MNDKVVPPYPRNKVMYNGSPWDLECDEIDEAAELLGSDGFAQAAAAGTQYDVNDLPVCAFFHGPSRRQTEEGICPLYGGHINTGGADSVMLCKGCGKQLHLYVETKLCEQGRKIYCPIWRAQQKNE